MVRWWKRWTMLAGGLVGVASWLTPVAAQSPGYQPLTPPTYPGTPPSGPLQPFGLSPESLPRVGAPPSGPQGPPPHPQSLEDHGVPNGFSDEEYYPQPEPYVFKLRAEYMFWHLAKPSLSTTVATTSLNPDPSTGTGALGQSSTSSLLGPGAYDYGITQGGRITAGFATGYFFPIEVSGFWTGRSGYSLLSETSDGTNNSPVLARPFFATDQQAEATLNSGFPGRFAGNIQATADINLWGIETNFFLNLGNSDVAGLDVIVGYRYANLSESLSIANSVQPLSTFTIPFNAVNATGFGQGFQTTATDAFQTRNQFNGGTIGLRPEIYVGQLTTSFDLKLSMGATNQHLDVNGQSQLLSGGGVEKTVAGGLLAVPSNIGSFNQSSFAIIPELDVSFGFNVTRAVKLFATYNILCWTSVVRPGDQLNNQVDSRQVPTSPNYNPNFTATVPGQSFTTTNFWAQGLTLGVEIGF